MSDVFAHTPVLPDASIHFLNPQPRGRYVDATLGGGGHSEMILKRSEPGGQVLGIDADPTAIRATAERLRSFGDRTSLREGYFDEVSNMTRELGWLDVDGILFDLGASSHQFDAPERGFSFQHDGPLDMRFGPGAARTAEELINSTPEDDLRRIFGELGEERYAGRIARRVVEERGRARFTSTTRLAHVVTSAKPKSARENIHPATRVFQALRIAVNDELERLRRALPEAVALLKDGGRLVVISFHSLEDRIVKQFMRTEASGCVCSTETPICVCGHTPSIRLLTRRPVTPTEEERAANPRSRSAKLRAAERIFSPTNTVGTNFSPRSYV